MTLNKVTKEARFPHGTPIEDLRAERRRLILEIETAHPAYERGTLGGDAERYYKAVADLTSFIARRAEIRAWLKALGPTTHRSRVTQADVRGARATWLKAGVKPKTINNRVFALAHLYRTLDGKRAPNPCDDLPALDPGKTPAIVVPDDLVRTVYQNLLALEQRKKVREPKTRARFMVYASTGRRPSEIGRAHPSDVDLTRRVWIPRDGKGGRSHGIYLNDDQLEAWKLFALVHAWGAFDVKLFARRLRAAGWPKAIRPYHLRHTVGLRASEAGLDLRDVGDHLGHKKIETTRKHYVPVLDSRMQKVGEALAKRKLGWHASDESPLVHQG